MDDGGETLRDEELVGEQEELEDSMINDSVSSDSLERSRQIHDYIDNEYCAKFLLCNARSLAPKMTSLIDYMYDLKCDIAIINETWFRGGKKLLGELSDVEQAAGIKFICKNRPSKAPRGGGVALAFNTARCNLKRKNLKSKYEMVGAVGKVGRIDRQVAVFSVYVPPKTRAAEFGELCEDLAAALVQVKTSIKDPVIIVGGDFNNRDPSPAFEAVGGLDKIPSGPTRGTAHLHQRPGSAGQWVRGDLPPSGIRRRSY